MLMDLIEDVFHIGFEQGSLKFLILLKILNNLF